MAVQRPTGPPSRGWSVSTWAPLAVLVFGAIVVGGASAWLRAHERATARTHLERNVIQVAARVGTFLQDRIQLIEHLRGHAEQASPSSQPSWSGLAGDLQASFPGFQSLNWVDDGAVVRYVAPLAGNEAAVGLDLAAHPVVGRLFAAPPGRDVLVSPPLALAQGGRGLVTYHPVFRDGEHAGWVSGVFRVQALLDHCLSTGRPPGLAFRFSDAETGAVLGTVPDVERLDWSEAPLQELMVGRRPWSVAVTELQPVGGLARADRVLLAVGLVALPLLAYALRDALRRRQDSHARYHGLIENAPEAITVLDVDTGKFVDVNEGAVELFGRSREQLRSLGPMDVSPELQPDGRRSEAFAGAVIARALGGERPVFYWTHLDAEGREVPCEVRLARLDVPGRSLVRGSITDITERLRAERSLRESEEQYRRIVDTALEGVWVIDDEGRTTFANQRMAEMLGTSTEAMLGRPFLDHLPEQEREYGKQNLERRREGIGEVHDCWLQRADGSLMRARLATNPLTDDEGGFLGALAMVSDLTEHRRLEDQLRHAQKMEAVGRLAGGVAHDFNNLLTSLLGAVDSLAERTRDDEVAASLVGEVRDASERAAALTRQLLAFSRKQVMQPEVMELPSVVTRMEPMLRRLLGEDVDLAVDIPPEGCRVLADPAQLEQVLLNLVVNARDAIPEGGEIQVRVRALRSEGGAPEALLEVEDHGPGVEPDLRARIFEPFFTTKETGRGTGLGLSTVHGIVAQSGGRLELDTEVGEGATFRVVLPLVVDAAAAPAEPSPPAEAAGGETVLVVEDDEAVRLVVERALERVGFRVLGTSTPAEALDLAARDEPLDLLLTDLVMPGMGGRELAREVQRRRPDVATLYMSGYSEGDARTGEGLGDVAFLHKPFTPRQLCDAVRSVLDADHAPRAG